MVHDKGMMFGVTATISIGCVDVCFFFLFLFDHNHTLSGKKTVTGMQVVTTSQVQIIECRSKVILLQMVCVCVAVTTLAQSSS